MDYVKKGYNPISLLNMSKGNPSTQFVEGDKHPRWKGGSSPTNSRRAKAVMEKHLNRNLIKGEMIHHLDHNRENNNIANLYLFSSNNKHRGYHWMKIQFIKEIIGEAYFKDHRIYGGDLRGT